MLTKEQAQMYRDGLESAGMHQAFLKHLMGLPRDTREMMLNIYERVSRTMGFRYSDNPSLEEVVAVTDVAVSLLQDSLEQDRDCVEESC